MFNHNTHKVECDFYPVHRVLYGSDDWWLLKLLPYQFQRSCPGGNSTDQMFKVSEEK